MSEILAGHCKDVATDFDAVVRSANFNVVIGETEQDVAGKLAWVRAHYEPLIPADRPVRQQGDPGAGRLS